MGVMTSPCTNQLFYDMEEEEEDVEAMPTTTTTTTTKQSRVMVPPRRMSVMQSPCTHQLFVSGEEEEGYDGMSSMPPPPPPRSAQQAKKVVVPRRMSVMQSPCTHQLFEEEEENEVVLGLTPAVRRQSIKVEELVAAMPTPLKHQLRSRKQATNTPQTATRRSSRLAATSAPTPIQQDNKRTTTPMSTREHHRSPVHQEDEEIQMSSTSFTPAPPPTTTTTRRLSHLLEEVGESKRIEEVEDTQDLQLVEQLARMVVEQSQVTAPFAYSLTLDSYLEDSEGFHTWAQPLLLQGTLPPTMIADIKTAYQEQPHAIDASILRRNGGSTTTTTGDAMDDYLADVKAYRDEIRAEMEAEANEEVKDSQEVRADTE